MSEERKNSFFAMAKDKDLNHTETVKSVEAKIKSMRTSEAGTEKGENFFREIFDYSAALPKAPDQPEGVQVRAGLSTLSGVYLPCCQNILGVIVFLRLVWLVGEAGSLEVFHIIFTCCLITFTTSIAMAAIATNGPVPAGGAYYMINRCLGPEFGGAVGMLFYIGTTFGSSMYVIGAIEIALRYLVGDTMLLDLGSGEKVLTNGPLLINNYRVYGTILLILLASIVYLGVVIVTKFAILALICVFGALASIFAGVFANAAGNANILVCIVGKRLVRALDDIRHCNYEDLMPFMCENGNQTCDPYFLEHRDSIGLIQAFPGLTSNIFMDSTYNLYSGENNFVSWSYEREDYAPAYEEGEKAGFTSEQWVRTDENQSQVTFLVLLGIFFPSCTGIMAGSNRSGDLKKPQHAIPIGTTAAIITTSCIYFSLSLLYSATVDRLVLLDKFGDSIAVGGGMVAAYLSFPPKSSPTTPSVTEVGALLSTIGAGLQSLTGAPRLLQAIAKDDFIPLLHPFATVDTRGEPFRALIITVLISEIGIIIGELDLIAPLLSMFFLLFYAGVNLACTVMSLSAHPGWRPSFRYYHWSVTMVGVILCVGAMFSINYAQALMALSIFGICFYGIKFFGGVQEWGAGVRGLALSFATTSLIRVSKNYTMKYWRPQILHVIALDRHKVKREEIEPAQHQSSFTGAPPIPDPLELAPPLYEWTVRKSDIQLFNLGSQIKQGAGLAIGATAVHLGSSANKKNVDALKIMIQETMHKQDLDGLAEISFTKEDNVESIRMAISSLVQLSGLGILRPNTVMVTFPKSNALEKDPDYARFKQILEEAVAYEMAIIAPVGDVRQWDEVVGGKAKGFIDMGKCTVGLGNIVSCNFCSLLHYFFSFAQPA